VRRDRNAGRRSPRAGKQSAVPNVLVVMFL
jgi:hypothetical protein